MLEIDILHKESQPQIVISQEEIVPLALYVIKFMESWVEEKCGRNSFIVKPAIFLEIMGIIKGHKTVI